MLFPRIFKLFAYVMGEVPADVFEDIQKDVRDMEGCIGFDLRWVHARLGAVAKARFDTHLISRSTPRLQQRSRKLQVHWLNLKESCLGYFFFKVRWFTFSIKMPIYKALS